MFQKFEIILIFVKKFFKKLGGTSKKRFLILLLIFIGIFVVAEIAGAKVPLPLGGLFDLAKAQVGGLIALAKHIIEWFFYFWTILVLSTLFLELSANILEWAMRLPINIMNNPIVGAGWTFIRDLVNLFFALALVAIAMAFILKIESFELKKSLPRLIIIALLINFSLLLVGAFIDVATILQNTILGIGAGQGTERITGLVTTTIDPLTGMAWDAVGFLAGMLIVLKIGLAIPYANVVALLTMITLALAMGEIFFYWVLLIFFNIVAGFIFVFLSLLFLFRVAALWILAIFAPLALMAYILPITQKYFDSWLKAVISWALLGIIVLFLLVLGMELMAVVFIGEAKDLTGFEFVAFYLFFLVYLGVTAYAALKISPAGVDIIISAVQTGIGRIAKIGIGTALGHKLAGIEAEGGARTSRIGEKIETFGDELSAKKDIFSRAAGSILHGLGAWTSRTGATMRDHAGRIAAGEHEKGEKKLKGKSDEEKTNALYSAKDPEQASIITSAISKDPGAIDHLISVIRQGGAKAEGLIKMIVSAYKFETRPENEGAGNWKNLQNALGHILHEFNDQFPSKFRIDPKKIFERIEADPSKAATTSIKPIRELERKEKDREYLIELQNNSPHNKTNLTNIDINNTMNIADETARAKEINRLITDKNLDTQNMPWLMHKRTESELLNYDRGMLEEIVKHNPLAMKDIMKVYNERRATITPAEFERQHPEISDYIDKTAGLCFR